ncbi:MAG: hypothetical protein IKF39_12680 [Oscillospiraceae bacterium]|nr:hypothetical protein [Oscillospiraceae bacterium]
MKRIIALIALLCLGTVILTSCGGKTVVDYGNATAFEAALNRGEDLKGKTVMITVDKFVPNSALGYNIQTGEHLNFVSTDNPGVQTGESIAVKVKEVQSALGSWIISYEILDNAVVGDSSILN